MLCQKSAKGSLLVEFVRLEQLMGPVGESTIAEALQQRSLAPSLWVLGALVRLHAVGFV